MRCIPQGDIMCPGPKPSKDRSSNPNWVSTWNVGQGMRGHKPPTTLSGIVALAYGLTDPAEIDAAVKQVAAANGIANPDVIQPGQRIDLPTITVGGRQVAPKNSHGGREITPPAGQNVAGGG